MEKFPTPRMVKYYAHPDGSATTAAPKVNEGAQSTSYKYDPANPVPTVGGNNLDLPCGPLDQSTVDQRADVLVFTTPAFTDELSLTGRRKILWYSAFFFTNLLRTERTNQYSATYEYPAPNTPQLAHSLGPLFADLYVSSDAVDTDFMVR